MSVCHVNNVSIVASARSCSPFAGIQRASERHASHSVEDVALNVSCPLASSRTIVLLFPFAASSRTTKTMDWYDDLFESARAHLDSLSVKTPTASRNDIFPIPRVDEVLQYHQDEKAVGNHLVEGFTRQKVGFIV